MFALSLIFNANKGQTAGVTLCSCTGCRKASAEFSPGMVLARGAAWPRWTDLSRRARPGVGLRAGTLSSAERPLAFSRAERGGSPGTPAWSSMNASCRVAFLLLNSELSGLLGVLMSTHVRVRSEASAGFGRGDNHALETLSDQGMQSPALSWRSCCQVVVSVFPRLCTRVLPETLVPWLAPSTHSRSLLVGGPGALPNGRWVMCELCAVSGGIYRL